jgi:Holliday junction resolvase RusA-like endonuclease
MSGVHFVVVGMPRPKQSFRMGNGHGYQPERVKVWQGSVASAARAAMAGRAPLSGDLAVTLDFYLPDRRRRDLDNLAKGTADAMNGIVWNDDQQITSLLINKFYGRAEPGVTVTVEPDDQPPAQP